MAEDTVDLAELKERLDDDRDLFLDISDVFFADYHNHADALFAAIEAKSADKVKEHAHTVKGALANLSVKKAAQIALQIEQAGKNNQLDGAAALLESLNAEIKNFQAFVEKVKNTDIWNS